jgi:proline iminopeptidase
VDEVEQVRVALGLDSSNFILLGHSWGGILAMEYALKYQQHLKGLIISNMVSSIPDYVKYANEVLGPQLPPEVLKTIRSYEEKGDYTNPAYLGLIQEHYYPEHILRMKPSEWPNPVNRAFKNINYPLYLKMQGPSEFGVVGDALLKNWDRTNDLNKIAVPTLTIGGEFDTMDPKAMEKMSTLVQKGSYLYCAKGSHMAMYDDQETYFNGVISFLKKL